MALKNKLRSRPVQALAIVLLGTNVTAQTVTSLRLIDADANLPIPAHDPITDGSFIDLTTISSTNLSIEALVDGATESVRFALPGNANVQTESVAPYALSGDSNGDFNSWSYSLGEQIVTATPYSASGASGTAGSAFTRSFTIDYGSGEEPGDFESAALETTAAGIYGELKRWHRVTLAFEGPITSETANPNPFTDFRLDVTFIHPSSGRRCLVPGYYAADGHAGETGADSGSIWRVHFSPDAIGEWNYTARFRTGTDVAISDADTPGLPATLDDNPNGLVNGSFIISETDKNAPDNRARGRLEYVDGHYLRYARTGDYFIKQGPDAPENLLAYNDFDGPFKSDGQKDNLIKGYAAHLADWNEGDPSWRGGKGRELIGAINYLASEGLNVFSFLTMNINGDDRNVFPYLDYNERERMDVSRLDQWEVVFDHADELGFYLHFKTQETENERLLDGGDVGPERTLYYRELIARFGHHLALNWNLGEESDDQSDAQRIAMADYFANHDPYGHNIVIHTYPGAKNRIYTPLLGSASALTGVSLQGGDSRFNDVHAEVLTWRANSAAANRPWVIAYDEPGNASDGLVPDSDDDGSSAGNHTDARARALWGTLMGGGTGNEWYFGYQHAHSDLTLEDFRSRDLFWDQARRALAFFRSYLPFHLMQPADELIQGASEAYCFALEDTVYAVYLPAGEAAGASLDLAAASGDFQLRWLNPRTEEPLETGTIPQVTAGAGFVALGSPPDEIGADWVALLRRTKNIAYIHGDVAQDGEVPSGDAPPYDQMLLTDSGNTGLSIFMSMVEDAGYTIEQFYDQDTTLDADFVESFDLIIFGLHQKIWSPAEKSVLDTWLRAGGGMLIYSDSASGGKFNVVGAQNPVGQTVTNNLIEAYGMEVTVDQANGIKAYRAGPGASHVLVADRLVLEGEGVSPIAVDPNGDAVRLIPYETNPDYTVSGDALIPHQQNLSIANPEFAALALARVENGRLIALFDRQPMWNDGPGSDIEKRDNTEMLRRIIRYLLGDLPDPNEADSDADGSPDVVEGTTDTDGDGTPDYIDSDSDDDGIPDFFERLYGTDRVSADRNSAGLEITRMIDTGTNTRLTFSWRALNAMTLGNNYRLSQSSDLGSWSTTSPVDWNSFDSFSDGIGYRRHTLVLENAGAKAFYRLEK